MKKILQNPKAGYNWALSHTQFTSLHDILNPQPPMVIIRYRLGTVPDSVHCGGLHSFFQAGVLVQGIQRGLGHSSYSIPTLSKDPEYTSESGLHARPRAQGTVRNTWNLDSGDLDSSPCLPLPPHTSSKLFNPSKTHGLIHKVETLTPSVDLRGTV